MWWKVPYSDMVLSARELLIELPLIYDMEHLD